MAEATMLLNGIAVSGGVAYGEVYIYKPILPKIVEEDAVPDTEILIFENALGEAISELSALKLRLSEHPEQAKIFDTHAELLDDEDILGQIREMIGERSSACWAVESVFSSYAGILEASADTLIQQRGADLRDVKDRLLRCLLGIAPPDLSSFSVPTIIAAEELNPSDTASMDTVHIVGIAAEQGGLTSHVAILAKSLGIPAILGVEGLTDVLRHGETVLLDSETASIYRGNPDELLEKYRRMERLYSAKMQQITKYLHRRGQTADGVRVHIGANIGSAETSELLAAQEADYIGLFRSEFLYMHSEHMPSEDEQFEAYKKVLSTMSEKRVTIRTLDIGGDKSLPYLKQKREMNPFLGLRALRLCLEKPEIFRTQLRALLRASVYGHLDIMFPMVSGLEEFRTAKQFTDSVIAELKAEKYSIAEDIGIGIMIETPSIALMSDKIVDELDFASVGTNDLCQYLTAADRGNPDVSKYYLSYHPAVFRTLGMVADAFNRRGKALSVCGELAGDPNAAPVLVGLGISKLSMSASSFAGVKAVLDGLCLHDMQVLSRAVCDCSTAEDVNRIISKN